MIITRSPFRISLFGGSTDYKSFYQQHGSLLIGMPIDKFCYVSMRFRPNILSKQYLCTYSKYELVDSIDELKNPLIRESLRYYNINEPVELTSFSDVPSRTGLGGSSSYCVALAYSLNKLKNLNLQSDEIIKNSIKIEREILKESGGIQDQIWPFAKGICSIEIDKSGEFFIKPMPITERFTKKMNESMVLIYTGDQRTDMGDIAKSHEDVVAERLEILNIAKNAYDCFLREDIKTIGTLLYESWKNKLKISRIISTEKINSIIDDVMNMGSYGAKLLGAGGSGFVLAICDEKSKKKILDKYSSSVLEFKIDNEGIKYVL